MEYSPSGVRFHTVNGGSLSGCVKGVPWCNSYFNSGGLEVWGGHAAEELINVEGCDWVLTGPCGGGGIARIIVESQWCPCAARV